MGYRFKNLCILVIITFFSFAMQAQRTELHTNQFEIHFVDKYELVYADRGTGADQDISIWKPITTDLIVGHVATVGYEKPTKSVMTIKLYDENATKYPVDYKLIYTDKGTGGDQDGAFWEPIAPKGYVALGYVATASYKKPSLKEVVCVKEEYTAFGLTETMIWNDKGSGGDQDVSIWDIRTPNVFSDGEYSFVKSNTFWANPSYEALDLEHANNTLSVQMIENLVGRYRRKDAQNEWHEGQIFWNKDTGVAKWLNNAGISWELGTKPLRAERGACVFATNKDNPYYKEGNEESNTFQFVMDEKGLITGFKFNGEDEIYEWVSYE
jgi:hypothetical protein